MTAPAVSPATIRFWKNSTRRISGTEMTIDAAAIGFGLLVLIADTIPGVPQLLAGSALLPIMAVGAVAGLVWLEIIATLPDTHRWAGVADRYRSRILGFVVLTVLATALRLLADLRLLH